MNELIEIKRGRLLKNENAIERKRNFLHLLNRMILHFVTFLRYITFLAKFFFLFTESLHPLKQITNWLPDDEVNDITLIFWTWSLSFTLLIFCPERLIRSPQSGQIWVSIQTEYKVSYV